MKAPEGYLRSNTTVYLSGAVTLSTMRKNALRALATPLGGEMIFLNVATMSSAVSPVPPMSLAISWTLAGTNLPSGGWCHLTFLRILKVYFKPPLVGFGTSPTHRSHLKSVGEPGLSGLTRISTL